MSDDFKIIQESTKKFVGGELCVMLILCKGIFSVEVVTQNKSFGFFFLETLTYRISNNN